VRRPALPSAALTETFERLLADPTALAGAYDILRDSRRTLPGTLDAIPRAVVVLCVSAWEAFVEALVREAVAALRPLTPQLGPWPALAAGVRGATGRFHTPNAENVRSLVADSLGLQSVDTTWTWDDTTPAVNREQLNQMLTYRHQVAHGVDPRPQVSIRYARLLLIFVRRLSERTDAAVRLHLLETLGVPNPWPE
jgi:hypothetical protein